MKWIGNLSTESLIDKLKRAYMASFTWGHVRTFFPVYLCWLGLIVHFYFLFLVGLSIAAYFPDFARGDNFYSSHVHHFMKILELTIKFFGMMTFMLSPYFLILKQYKNAFLAVVYSIFVFIAFYSYWPFVYNYSEKIVTIFWCPNSVAEISSGLCN